MPKLLVYQAIWAMENQAGIDLDNCIDAALDSVFEAGFDGVGVSLLNGARAEIVSRGVLARGGSFEAGAFVRTPDHLAWSIKRAEDLGAHHINVQVVERKDRVSDAVALMRSLEDVARKASIPVRYETHRGRLTNDLLFTLRLLEAMPDIDLTGDLSHYPLVHEFPLPVPPEDLDRMTRVLARCAGFHGRVCGSHQVQVSIVAAQHQAWLEQFKLWWLEGFSNWLARARPEDELTFMTELGPPNYAITDANGAEISDRWIEALLLKDIARELWAHAMNR